MALPATSGARPVISASVNNLTLGANNLIRGLDLSSSGGTSLTGSNFGNLTVSEVSVSNSSGGAVSLNTGNPTASFTSISSNGGSNGIILQSTTGSFTVTGSGGTCTEATPTCTGGRIQNTTGADSSASAPAGAGVALSSATSVSLSLMRIDNHSNYAIRGTTVSGFTLNNSVVNGVNGTNAASPFNDGSIVFSGLTGTASISNSTVSGGYYRNISIVNSSGVLNLTISNDIIKSNSDTAGDVGVLIEANTTANITTGITNNTFGRHGSDHIVLGLADSAVVDSTISGNTLNGNYTGTPLGNHPFGGGNGILVHDSNFNGSFTYDILNNVIKGSRFNAIGVNKFSGTGTFSGTISDNTIGDALIADSGSSLTSGIVVTASGTGGSHTSLIDDNDIHQFNFVGIYLTVGQDGDLSVNSTYAALNVTVSNNLIDTPDAVNAQHGILLDSGFDIGDNNVSCVNILNNPVSNGGNEVLGGFDIRVRQRQATRVNLPGYAGTAFDTTAVQTYLAGRNTLSSVSASANNDGSTTNDGYFNGGSACTVPSLMASVPDMANLAFRPAGEKQPARSPIEYKDILFAPESREGGTGITPARQIDLFLTARAAIARLRALGVSDDILSKLEAIRLEIADLPDDQLAITTPGRIVIDENAAGYGWFVDVTPQDNSEFAFRSRRLSALDESLANGRMDLLTAVTRGFVYVLDHQQLHRSTNRHYLLERTLAPSVRRMPERKPDEAGERQTSDRISMNRDAGRASTYDRLIGLIGQSARRLLSAFSMPTAYAAPDLRSAGTFREIASMKPVKYGAGATMAPPPPVAGVVLNIGTLPAGKTITITFNVTINNPFGGATNQVSNQGEVTADGGISVLTDDPDVGGTADPTVTIVNLPSVTVAVSPTFAGEYAATNLVYTFTRTGSTAAPLTVNFNVLGTATFNSDYTQTGATTFSATTGTVTFGAGMSTATVNVDPENDDLVEGDENVRIFLTAGTGYVVGASSLATGTISDGDSATLSIEATRTVTEAGAAQTVTVTLTTSDNATLAIALSAEVVDGGGGTATSGTDYTAFGTQPVSFPVGSGDGATRTVTLTPVDDRLVEGNETVNLTLQNINTTLGGVVGLSATDCVATISDNDAAAIAFTATSSNAPEAITPHSVSAMLTITANGSGAVQLGRDVSVNVQNLLTGSATVVADYGFSSPQTITFLAGDTGSTKSVSIGIANDNASEGNETINLQLNTLVDGTGGQVALVAPTAHTVTIVDNDIDLKVTKTESADPVTAGSGPNNLRYTVKVENAGLTTATGIALNEDLTLPAGVTVSMITQSQGSFTPTTAPDGTWSVGTLTPGNFATLTVYLTAGASTATGINVICNTATVTASNETRVNTSDDSATECTSVAPQADLEIVSITDNPDPVCPNSNLTYTIKLRNNGPAAALNSTVTFAVPMNTTFVSATQILDPNSFGQNWSVSTPPSGGTGNVVFSKASVAKNEMVNFRVVVKAKTGLTAGSQINGAAAAASSTPDLYPSNNSKMTTTTVGRRRNGVCVL